MGFIFRIIIYIFIIVFFSCRNTNGKNCNRLPNSITEENYSVYDDTLFYRNDTIVIAQFSNDKKAVILKWGSAGKELNTGNDTLPYSSFGFYKTYKARHYFIVEGGCGTGCKYFYFISLKSNREGLFLSPLAFDLNKEIIVYQGESMNELVTIQNIASGKRIRVKEEFDKTKRPLRLAIDTAIITQNKLILKWYSPLKKKIIKEINLESIL